MGERESEIWERKEKRNQIKAKFEQTVANQEMFKKARDSEAGMKQYYESLLPIVKAKREQAEKDEKDYTYRMWGPFKSMWENDVKLAKEKVQRFEKEEIALRAKIAEVLQANNAAVERDVQRGLVEAVSRAKGEGEMINQDIEARQAHIRDLETARDEAHRHIAWHVKQEGKVDVDHYFTAMEAMNGAGKSFSKAAGQGKIISAGWVKDLASIGLLLQKMCRSNKLENQLKAYNALQEYTSDPKNALCMLLQHAGPVLSLDDIAIGGGVSKSSRKVPLLLFNVGEKRPSSELKPLPELKAPATAAAAQPVGQEAVDLAVSVDLAAETAAACEVLNKQLSCDEGDETAFSDTVNVDDLAARVASEYEDED